MASVDTSTRVQRGRSKPSSAVAAALADSTGAAGPAKHLIAMTQPPPSITEQNGKLILTTRLPSLVPPRDLTLGGRTPPKPAVAAGKKNFLPNLKVVRNKNAPVKTSKDTSRGGRGARGGAGVRGGTTRGRGRGGMSSSLIQTTGLFSEGAGAVHLRKSSGAHSATYSRNEGETAAQMRRPTYVKRELKKSDLKEEADLLLSILGDSEEEDATVDEKAEDFPVKLNDVKLKVLKPAKVKLEPMVKQEIDETLAEGQEEDSDTLAVARELQRVHLEKQHEVERQMSEASASRHPRTVADLLKSEHQTLFLLQMPDFLPADTEESPEPEAKRKEEPSTSTAAATASGAPASATPAEATASALLAPPKAKAQSMHHLQEGQIGKVIRYRSGKTKLMLGQTMFDLNMGMETTFLQHLMSINANPQERNGNMIDLGQLNAKVTATPDWEHLLKFPL